MFNLVKPKNLNKSSNLYFTLLHMLLLLLLLLLLHLFNPCCIHDSFNTYGLVAGSKLLLHGLKVDSGDRS